LYFFYYYLMTNYLPFENLHFNKASIMGIQNYGNSEYSHIWKLGNYRFSVHLNRIVWYGVLSNSLYIAKTHTRAHACTHTHTAIWKSMTNESISWISEEINYYEWVSEQHLNTYWHKQIIYCHIVWHILW